MPECLRNWCHLGSPESGVKCSGSDGDWNSWEGAVSQALL